MPKLPRRQCLEWVLLLVLVGFGCAGEEGRQSRDSRFSVSGVSAGAFFAVQMQVAYSSSILGAGVIAGGPYWCAADNLVTALTACMNDSSILSVDACVSATYYAEGTGTIDAVSNMKNHKVWVFSGKKDTVVETGVVKKLVQYYENFVDGDIVQVFNISSEHALVTDTFGSKCDYLGSPYINNCGFDSAGDMFHSILGDVVPPVAANKSLIRQLDTIDFLPAPWASPHLASLGDTAFMYVPTDCQGNMSGCHIHVSFHGCYQYPELIGDDYYWSGQFNTWAESNKIIVLYPQACPSTLNPRGCFDWWGYTGADYACQLGVQMQTVWNMVQYIKGN